MRLPSLIALQMLEASARLGSFTRAAAELSVTESTVCRQVLAMEERYGVSFFERVKRKLVLTSEGERYVREIRDQIRAIEHATKELAARAGGKEVIDLAVIPTFATQWLVPRLAAFAREQPRIIVNVYSRTDPFSLPDSRFDAAVYMDRAPWPGVMGKRLLVEGPSVAVCGPELARHVKIRSKSDFINYPLLHVMGRPDAWEDWIGRDDEELRLAVTQGSRFELFTMAIRAAATGLGIALMPKLFIQDELNRKILVPVFEEDQPCNEDEPPRQYFISCRAEPVQHKVAVFMSWLGKECGEF